jgi:hypothetical protein
MGMTMSASKLLSLLALVASIGLLAACLPASSAGLLFAGCIVGALGLALIWFPAELAGVGFQRGEFHESPAVLVAAFGWLFLLGYPILLLWLLQ